MEELVDLRTYIEQGRYADALHLLGDMDEMSREDKINKIESFLMVLLLHLIKQHAEKRTTRSWDISIRNAVRQIMRSNQRQRAGGYYLDRQTMRATIDDVYSTALDFASLEAFGGLYDSEMLATLVDESAVKTNAMRLIWDAASQ
jgi:hypothetical protein